MVPPTAAPGGGPGGGGGAPGAPGAPKAGGPGGKPPSKAMKKQLAAVRAASAASPLRLAPVALEVRLGADGRPVAGGGSAAGEPPAPAARVIQETFLLGWGTDAAQTEQAVRCLFEEASPPVAGEALAWAKADAHRQLVAYQQEFAKAEERAVERRGEVEVIRMDARFGNVVFRDQFLWDVYNFESDPDQVARTFCEDLGLPGEVVAKVSIKLRTEIYRVWQLHSGARPPPEYEPVVGEGQRAVFSGGMRIASLRDPKGKRVKDVSDWGAWQARGEVMAAADLEAEITREKELEARRVALLERKEQERRDEEAKQRRKEQERRKQERRKQKKLEERQAAERAAREAEEALNLAAVHGAPPLLAGAPLDLAAMHPHGGGFAGGLPGYPGLTQTQQVYIPETYIPGTGLTTQTATASLGGLPPGTPLPGLQPLQPASGAPQAALGGTPLGNLMQTHGLAGLPVVAADPVLAPATIQTGLAPRGPGLVPHGAGYLFASAPPQGLAGHQLGAPKPFAGHFPPGLPPGQLHPAMQEAVQGLGMGGPGPTGGPGPAFLPGQFAPHALGYPGALHQQQQQQQLPPGFQGLPPGSRPPF